MPGAMGCRIVWTGGRVARGPRRRIGAPQGRHPRMDSLIFAAIVVATFWGQWAAIEQHWKSVGPAVFALNVTAMALGLGVARMLRLAPRPAIAIAVECGMQNVAVALFVTIGLLGVPELAIPAMIYAIAMNVSVLVMIAVGRQITARETGAAGGRDS